MDVFFLVVAWAVGLAVKLIKLPTLVGYLVAGLLLAALGFKADATLKQIGDLGVMFLLFTLGLHIRLQNVLRIEVLGVGGLHLLVSAMIYSGVLLLLGFTGTSALLMAIGLGFSSTVLTAKALESRDELDSYHGRLAIGILILQDLVAVALLAFTGSATPTLWALCLIGLPLLRPALLYFLRLTDHDDLLLLFGVLLAVGGGAMFELVGLDAKLGALVAGILLAGDTKADELSKRLWGIKELFLIGFFLLVGLAGFPEPSGVLTALVLLALLPLKAVCFFGLFMIFRLRARTGFMTSLALAAYSEFALIVATAGAASGVVPTEVVLAIALLVVLSYALNAYANQKANRLWLRLESWLVRWERAEVEHPDKQPESIGSAAYIVVGMGRAGAAAYDYLVEHGERPLGFEADPNRLAENLQAGRRVHFADAQDPELWRHLNLDQVQGVLLAVPNLKAKLRSARLLREEGYRGAIRALVREEADDVALREEGIQAVGVPLVEAGKEMAELSLQETPVPA
ncbi:MAG: cation:proton antiporter [Planctomycetota bacterium]